MSTPITQHVRSLPTSANLSPEFWPAFRRLVRAEWRRLRLRSCPPSFLGYPAAASWQEAWEDLVSDCYLAAILEQREQFRQCLDQQGPDASVDALVRRHIRWFLQRRRADSDEVGTAVYRRLHTCLRRLLDAGEVQAAGLRPDGRIRPDAVFFLPGQAAADMLDRGELERLVAELSPWRPVIRRIGNPRRQGALPALLADAVQATVSSGAAFRLADLATVVQARARRALHAVLRARCPEVHLCPAAGPGGDHDFFRTEPEPGGYSGEEDLEVSVERVRALLPGLRRRDAATNLNRVLEAALPALRSGEWPSVRALAARLSRSGPRIGKTTVADCLATLKGLLAGELQTTC